MNIFIRNLLIPPLSLILFASVSGCGTLSSVFGGKKVDYQKSAKLPPLEVPPDLTLPTADERYAVPDQKAPANTATFSTYSRDRVTQQGPVATGQSALLPSPDKAHVERSGAQRWLTVKAPPEQVWPAVRQFWLDAGYELKAESVQTGVMETEWLEGKPKIQESGIRGLFQRTLGTLYSTGMRDKFRTRLERTADGGTEVYISHRGMEEVVEGRGGNERTIWQPRPSDPSMEAEMLQKLLVKFGTEEEIAKSQIATQDGSVRARLTTAGEGGSQLLVTDSFDRAWRRVGLALDRVGFTVEDRDRSKGIYFVRYIDPQSDAAKDDKGLLSKFMFWRSDSKVADNKSQYRIRVSENGSDSKVQVENAAGTVEKSLTANRILTLLFEQLK